VKKTFLVYLSLLVFPTSVFSIEAEVQSTTERCVDPIPPDFHQYTEAAKNNWIKDNKDKYLVYQACYMRCRAERASTVSDESPQYGLMGTSPAIAEPEDCR